MDVPVTVDAPAAGHHIYPCFCTPSDCEREVVEGNVAIPAQPDGRGFQQGGIGAAVRLMAIEAILHDGRVLKEERTSVLGVTFEAKFFGGNSLYELGRSSPVRVVATRSVHLSLAQGMMRKFVLGANLLFMTGSARIRYGYQGELSTVRYSRSRMDRVARGAIEALGGMSTARPEKPLPLLMALETGIVAHGNRRWRPLCKSNHSPEGFASRTNMICSRSMTRFTPNFFRSGTGVLQKEGAHSRLCEPIVHLGVTGLAYFRACNPFIDLFGLFVPLFRRRF